MEALFCLSHLYSHLGKQGFFLWKYSLIYRAIYTGMLFADLNIILIVFNS